MGQTCPPFSVYTRYCKLDSKTWGAHQAWEGKGTEPNSPLLIMPGESVPQIEVLKRDRRQVRRSRIALLMKWEHHDSFVRVHFWSVFVSKESAMEEEEEME